MAAQCVEESAGEKVNVNLDELIDYINLLLNRREKADQEKTRPDKKPFKWPGGSDWRELNEILSSGIEFVSDRKDVTSGAVKAILKKIGNANLATAGLLVVAECLERFDGISNNDKECLDHLKEMTKVASLVKAFQANTKEESVIEDATAMIVEGAIICCAQLGPSKGKRFLAASKNKEDLRKIAQDLHLLYSKMGAHASVRAVNAIERLERLLAANAIERLERAINPTQFNLQPEESCAQPATVAPQCVKESVGENVDGIPHCVEESAGVPNWVEEYEVFIHSVGESLLVPSCREGRTAGVSNYLEERTWGVSNCVQENAMAMRRLCCCIPFLEDKDGEDSADDLDNLDNPVKHISDLDIPADDLDIPADYLDNLVKYISDLLSLRKQKKLPHKKFWTWPNGSDWKSLNETLSSGIDFVSDLKDYISGPVKSILKAIGNASLATAGLLVVAYSLERFDDISSNNEKCFKLLKEMLNVANLVKILKENPKEMENEIEDATGMIVTGAIICCGQMDSSPWNRFLNASKNKEDLSDITGELNTLYIKIAAHGGLRAVNDIGRLAHDIDRVLIAAERKRKPPLSRKYPTHAVGIENSITEVLHLLECKSEKNAVTVILHGFGGTGKSTLADAVFSQIEGYDYSVVELGSYPNIVKLQKAILKDLMEPEALIPNFRRYLDGQRELREVLIKNVQAFIYIDNVLDGDDLQKLLPPDLDTANKVRFLLTARDENVKFKCPRSGTKPKIYPMKYIEPPQAKLILLKEIREGPEGLNPSQFNDIIQICGGIPLMLTLAAPFIGRADDKKMAYDTLKREAGKLGVAHEGNPSCGNESESESSESGPSSPKTSPMASGEEE